MYVSVLWIAMARSNVTAWACWIAFLFSNGGSTAMPLPASIVSEALGLDGLAARRLLGASRSLLVKCVGQWAGTVQKPGPHVQIFQRSMNILKQGNSANQAGRPPLLGSCAARRPPLTDACSLAPNGKAELQPASIMCWDPALG